MLAHRRLTGAAHGEPMTDVVVQPKPVPTPTPAVASGSGLDVVYVLSLMQVAFILLAAVGEELLMGGSPAYLIMPLAKIVLILVFATKALRRRRWALRGLVILQWITLVGFGLQLIGGLLPWVDFTVNLVGLLTNLVLPLAVIWLCRPELRSLKAAKRATRVYPVPQDPYAPIDPTMELSR
jgi:hypothetical protein